MGDAESQLCSPETSSVSFGELGGVLEEEAQPLGRSREGPEPENCDFGVLLVFPEALQT